MEVTRLWLMFFKLKYLNSVESNIWRKIIDSNDEDHNFWIKNMVPIFYVSMIYVMLHTYKYRIRLDLLNGYLKEYL